MNATRMVTVDPENVNRVRTGRGIVGCNTDSHARDPNMWTFRFSSAPSAPSAPLR